MTWLWRHSGQTIRDGGLVGAGRRRTLSAEQVRDLLLSYSRRGTAAVHPARINHVRVVGSLDLSHLRLGYDLDLTGCVITGELVLTGTTIGSVDLSDTHLTRLLCDHARIRGDLRLPNARIGAGPTRQVDASPDSAFRNRRGDQVQTSARVLDPEVIAPLKLTSSRIDGDVVLADAAIHTDQPWAVYAPRLQVSGSFIGSGLRTAGGINLSEARLENSILLDRAHVGAGDASIVTVRGGFFADWGFIASGPVELLAMQAGNIVTFHGSELRGWPISANLTRLATSRLRLDTQAAPSGRLILRDVHVNSLIDSAATWPADGDLDLEGLAYDRVGATEPVTVRERIGWLARDRNASASSFGRLATHYRNAGDERSARTVGLAGERHLRQHQGLVSRLWGWIQDALFGYGFAPTRALLWLATLVGTGGWWFANHPVRPLKQLEHPTWDPLLYALDLVIPLVDLGQEKAWDPVGPDKAVAMTLIVTGWLLATAVVAGARRLFSRS